MTSNDTLIAPQRKRIHPQLFALMTGLASVVMMFVALTSAYIVKKPSGPWLNFALPSSFYISTVLIVLSSVTLFLAKKAFMAKNANQYRILLTSTFLLGMGFVVYQYLSWQQLGYESGVNIRTDVSSSFLGLIAGLHVLHVMGGIGALTVSLVNAFAKPVVPSPKRVLHLDMVSLYWHFVDVLWLYLFVFFVIQHSF